MHRPPLRAPALLFVALCCAAPAPAATPAALPRGVPPEIPLGELQLTHWGKREGLPTETLIELVQDSRGFLWIAGFGGAARFDGMVFESFNQRLTPELEASSFYDILEVDGAILLATLGTGLWQLEGQRFRLAAPDSRDSSIRSLCLDRTGTVWVGLADGGAARLEGDRLVAAGPPSFARMTIRDILETADGALWFGSEGGGLARLHEGRIELFTTAHGLVDDSVTSLDEAADGGLWIATQNGLGRLRAGELSAVPGFEGLEIFAVAEDDHGSVWAAAEQGLFRRNGLSGQVERLSEKRGRSLRSINGLAFDHEGSVWVSSYTSGLYQLRESSFLHWTADDGLATERVNGVFERRDGTLLIGGDLGIVQTLADGRLSRLELPEPLPEVRVRGFHEEPDGTLWIASYAGLLRLGRDGQRLLTVDDGLPTNRVRFVQRDGRGRLWAGTRGGGLVELTPGGGFRSLDTTDGLASDFVLALAEEPSGRLLVGTQSGLSVVEPDGRVFNLTVADGLPADLVFSIRLDAEGAAWIATGGGLARYADGRIDAATTRQGLPSTAVYDYAEDRHGQVWLSSSDGLIQLPKAQLEELFAGRRTRLEARLLDEADGMADPQCTGGARMLTSRGGQIWIPTLGGLARIDPDRLPTNPIPPPVHIHQVRVDHRPLEAPADGRLEIGPETRRFEFRFSALSFRAPSKVEVRYRLEGFDDDWMVAGPRRTALYTHLPPGDFVFRVIAANRDGVWNREGAGFGFRVRRHAYQKPLFLALAGLLLVAAPWAVFRWRLRIVHRRSRRLEHLLSEQHRLESERLRLVGELERQNEQLENLTHAVSHDLKSPLVTIHGFVGALERDIAAGDHERVESDLSRIRNAASYMGRLLEQLNRVRRLELSNRKPEEIDLAELAHEVLAAVAGRIEERGIRVEVDPAMPPVVGDRLQLTEVLQNLVDNAARFVGDEPRPRIEIGCRRGGERPVYFVRDNGVGLEPRYHERIFGLFQRLDRRPEGTGVGLTIVKRIIEAHAGRVWVESVGRGEGSTFCFTLGGAIAAGRGRPARRLR